MTIRYLERKTVKQRLWKTLNFVVGVTTILNVSMVGALIKPMAAEATGPTWPTDGQWVIPICNDDVRNEAGVAPDEVDLYTPSSSDYAAAYFIDANTLYLRERVDGNPGTPGDWNQYAWVFMVQKDAASTDYDFLVSLRGSGSGENVQLHANTVKEGPIDFDPIFNDPADETPLNTWPTSTNSRRVTVGSDYYVDWQIPVSELTSRGVQVTNGRFTNSGLYWATSTNANNYNKDHLNCYESSDIRVSKEVRKNGGAWFDDGRLDAVSAAPGDSLQYRVTLTNAGGPEYSTITATDELGKNFNDGDGDASHNIDPSIQYSDWTTTKNLNSDGNGLTFSGSWGNGSADGQSNDTLTLTLPRISGGGAQEQFTFDSTIRNDLAVGSHLLENVATVGQKNAETDVPVTVTPTRIPNPPLGQSCGLDIALVVDTSGSVDSSEMSQMKTALKNFAVAFDGTPTVFSLSSFATNSVLERSFSRSPIQMGSNNGDGDGDIDDDIPSSGDGYTNWDSGLKRGNSTFDPRPAKADLIVIATDGSPNHWGYPTATGTFDWNLGLMNAIPTANDIKSEGTRIVVVGIGEDGTDPATPAEKLEKMKSISGDNVATTPGAITTATDVIKVTDFSGIGSALAAFANELCGGKILVQKQFDTNGDGQADVLGNVSDPLLGGWTFDVNGSPSNPNAQVTTNTGSLEFSVLNGTYSVVETQKANTQLVSAQCFNGTQPVGTVNLQTGTVSGLVMGSDDTISCTFVNGHAYGSLKVTKIVSGGTALPHEFGFRLVGSNGNYIYPANGQNNVVFPNLQPGQYSVEETGPNGYHQSNTTCSNVLVTAGQQATCTVTNTRDTGRVTFDKIVPGYANDESLFTFHVNGQGNYHDGDSASFETGTYVVTEDAVSGYSFASASGICALNDKSEIVMTVGANGGTCTITNTRDLGTLIVHKNVINPDGGEVADAHQFTVSVSGQSNGTIAEGTDAIYSNIPTGTYTVTELPDGNYTFVSYSADNDAAPGAQVVVTKNSTTHLTVTNQQKKVEIVVHKNVVAYDGQTDVADNQAFTADVNGATGAISESQTFSTFVNPGWVTVGEPNVPTNYVLVNIVPSNFQVASGDQPVHVTITNKQKPSSITGSKFNDLNGNGTWDQGEPGLADWTICMNEHGATDQPVCDTTNVNGAYSFGPLIPGNYHVWEIQQNGWMQTAPQGNLYDVTVGPNETAANKDFGNFKLGKISGYKFNDLDGDGTWDQGEPGLAGWTIQLSGSAAAADVTDANGYYEFTGLLYGTYSVQEVQQIGWMQTTANPANVDVISGTDSQDNNFGNFARGSISGRKFDDLNGNGTWDQGEPTIAGWTIYLNDGDNVTPTQTDANGLYSFSNLGPDSYTVSENLVTGWIQTFPPQNGTYLVTLTSGANVTDKDFGNFMLGKISGYKFNDLNGNGSWNQGEPGIAGWGMTLSNGQQNWNMVTDGTGYYEFTGLMVGTYSVTEENRSGWTPTTPSSINGINVTSGVNSQANNFGNFELVSLNGSKFNDLNGNGAWDNGEPGLANWTINLDQDANGSVDATTVTDGSGNYSFANLGPGTYRLREVQQAGWTQTSANPADVTVVSGTNVDDLDFGNFALGTISGYKFNDLNGNGTWDQGEPTIQGWTIKLWSNGNEIDSTQTDVNGLYTFGGLVADTYSVTEQVATGWTQTTANPAPIVMTSGLNSQANNFGNFELVSLNGSKFNDLNGNGAWDNGEPGLANWTINLDQDANGSVDATTVTDGSGNYSFANLGPGTYRLREVQQAGWTQTSANPADVTVVSGTNVDDLDFGNFRYGRIEGYKLNEFEQGLANWTICLDDGENLQCTQTDSNGHYAFDQLPYGTYTVSEVLPYGWTQLSPLDPNTYTVLVTSGVGQSEGHAWYNFVNQRNAFEVDLDKIAPETVNAGDQMTYTINWTVTGNTPVSNLIVTDNLPSNTSFVSASNGGTYDSNLHRVTWDLGTKIPADNGSLTVTVNVASPLAKGTTLENYAQICGQGDLVIDGDQKEGPTTKCDDDTTTTTVNSDVSVNLVKTDSVDPVAAGAQLTYTLTWTVSGNAPIDNLVITDPLPANTQFVSATNGGTFALGTITWNLGAQTPGANGAVSFTVTVASPIVNGTVLTNTAEACVDSFTRTQEEVLHRCDSDDETTVVTSAPLLSIVKSSNITTFVNPGSTAQYTVTITNAATATDTARNVVMTDTLPTGFTFAVDGTTTKSFAIGNLVPGQSATVTYLVNISGTQAAGIYNNLAKAKGDNTNEVSATTPIEVRVPQVFGLETTPDLTIVKTAGAKNAKPGDVVTYTLTVKNIGDGDAENVIITDTLPKDLSFVHATGRTMTWSIGTLKAGHTRIINVDVRVESDAKSGTYTNVATVRSDEVPEKSATADLIVKRPVVLGLATTGVGMLDYAIGLVGMALVALGILGLRRRSIANNLE